jgi:cell division protein FtsB
MKKFPTSGRFRQFIASRSAQAFLALILILVGEGVFQLYQRERLIAKEEASLRRELDLLEAKRLELLASVARLETDRGVEEVIRESFGVVKEGEKVINLIGVATATAVLPATVEASWWRGIVEWFR